MIKITKQLPATGNAYILFGFEAIQARPNLDPYSSTLRMNDETGQVFTSDVHIKHHVRRGLKAYALAEEMPHASETVFYEKEDDAKLEKTPEEETPPETTNDEAGSGKAGGNDLYVFPIASSKDFESAPEAGND